VPHLKALLDILGGDLTVDESGGPRVQRKNEVPLPRSPSGSIIEFGTGCLGRGRCWALAAEGHSRRSRSRSTEGIRARGGRCRCRPQPPLAQQPNQHAESTSSVIGNHHVAIAADPACRRRRCCPTANDAGAEASRDRRAEAPLATGRSPTRRCRVFSPARRRVRTIEK
jgi:hypothetical protein